MTERLNNHSPGGAADGASPLPAVAIMEQPIELSGVLGLEQLLRVHRLTATKVAIWPVVKSVVAIGIMFGLMAAFGLYIGQPAWATWLLAGSFAFILVMVASLYSLNLYRSGEAAIQRAFQKGSMRPQSVVWTVSTEGLATVTETVTSRLNWNAYRSVREGEDLILLYIRDATAIVPLAKEFCQSDDDWDRLRQFLRSKFPDELVIPDGVRPRRTRGICARRGSPNAIRRENSNELPS